MTESTVSLIGKLEAAKNHDSQQSAATIAVNVGLSKAIEIVRQHGFETTKTVARPWKPSDDPVNQRSDTLIQILHDMLHKTDADIAFGKLRYIIAEYEKLKLLKRESVEDAAHSEAMLSFENWCVYYPEYLRKIKERESGEEMVPKWALDSQIEICNELRVRCERLEGKPMVEGMRPVDPKALEPFMNEMCDKVIPEIEKTMRERAQAAEDSRHKSLK